MKKIKILVMDVDGTLTDGKIYMGINGEIMKAFNVKDGAGINKLHKNGIMPVIITGRKSTIVEERAKELKIIELHQGIENKVSVLEKILQKYNLSYDESAYIGDDDNDLECMKLCGIAGCPADATNSVKLNSKFISKYKGGNGAVREFIDFLIKEKETTAL